MENKIKHLEMIQHIIDRLSNNSFLLKGWTVLLISALFALSANNTNVYFLLLAFVPAFVFWGLDGYFLWREKHFRSLYDYVRRKDNAEIDFSMDTSGMTAGCGTWGSCTLSRTLIPFYGVLLLAIFLVVIITHYFG